MLVRPDDPMKTTNAYELSNTTHRTSTAVHGS